MTTHCMNLYNISQYHAARVLAIRPPSHADGAISANAEICDHIASPGRAAIDATAPSAIRTASTAACTTGRFPAIRAVSQPATSANTQPQMTLAILKLIGAGWWGSMPDNWNRRKADAPKTMYPAATAPALRSMSQYYRRPRLPGEMRFLRFNGVGVAGFVLQIGVLAVLVRLDVHYLIATALAVECAVLHNFFWHERWTWADRPADGRTRLLRLGRFHALNGTVSLGGNLLLMRLFVGTFGIPPIPANLLSVLACAAVNYFGSDRVVFRERASRLASPGIAPRGSRLPPRVTPLQR